MAEFSPPVVGLSAPPGHGVVRVADRVADWLMAPVNGNTIAVFRILFAVCTFAQTLKWWDMFEIFEESYVLFPYPGIRPCPVDPETGRLLLTTMAVASLMMLMGVATRAANVVCYLIFAYVFHLCESNHNNHYILMCHILFVTIFLDWGRCMSLDAVMRTALQRPREAREPTVPYYHLLLLQIIMSIPYFFGAVAKMNYDWLFRAEPVTTWFGRRREAFYHLPYLPWFISWSGMGYDLIISFLLFYRPTRYVMAFPFAVFFNFSNKLMFDIGVFPLAMVSSLVLFVPPQAPAHILHLMLRPITPPALRSFLPNISPEPLKMEDVVTGGGDVESGGGASLLTPGGGAGSDSSRHRSLRRTAQGGGGGGAGGGPEESGAGGGKGGSRVPAAGGEAGGRSPGWGPRLARARRAWALLFVGAFCTFHVVFPTRHFWLYSSNPSWTEEGHLGAWHMMLRTKTGWTYLIATDQAGKTYEIVPQQDPMISSRQSRKVASRPHVLMLYVEHLQALFAEAGLPLQRVEARSCYQLNGREGQALYMPDANLLDYAGRYETIGTTAVGRWLTPVRALGDRDGICSPSRNAMPLVQSTPAVLGAVQRRAGFTYNPDRPYRSVWKDGRPAYMWRWGKPCGKG